METNTRKGVLAAGTAFGFAYWAALLVVLVKTGAFVKSAVEVPKIGFFEGVKILIERIKTGGIGWDTYLSLFVFLMLIVAPLFGLVSVLKDSKKLTVPAIIASVLSLNFFAGILYIIGARPRFLDGRKTMLFIAGYIGVIGALLWLGLSIGLPEGKVAWIVLTVITAAAVVLNFVGWRKNHSVVTFIAGIVYVLSVIGIPSAVLCFIGARPLLFLNGRKTILFVAGFIGTIGALLWLVGLSIGLSIGLPMAEGKAAYIVLTVITTVAIVLNFVGWRKNHSVVTFIAGIAYVLSGVGIPSAVLCFIGARPLSFLNGRKTILFVAGFIGTIGALFWLALSISLPVDTGKTAYVVFTVITAVAVILNWIGWQKNNAKLTRIAAILYILSIVGIPSAILCFIGYGKLKKEAQAG
ncbi:hypothetical protein FACS1894137_05480 [Spirochaetia bacterium]|nr:hypothetical protein FACS1894137_05480 [Spirochaetia bacterium]